MMLSWGTLRDEGCASLGLSHNSLQYQEFQYDPPPPICHIPHRKSLGMKLSFHSSWRALQAYKTHVKTLLFMIPPHQACQETLRERAVEVGVWHQARGSQPYPVKGLFNFPQQITKFKPLTAKQPCSHSALWTSYFIEFCSTKLSCFRARIHCYYCLSYHFLSPAGKACGSHIHILDIGLRLGCKMKLKWGFFKYWSIYLSDFLLHEPPLQAWFSQMQIRQIWCNPSETHQQGIMIVLFIKTNIQSKTMNITTMIPCRHIAGTGITGTHHSGFIPFFRNKFLGLRVIFLGL